MPESSKRYNIITERCRELAQRLSEIEDGSKDSVLMTALMPLQYPTGEGQQTAVESR